MVRKNIAELVILPQPRFIRIRRGRGVTLCRESFFGRQDAAPAIRRHFQVFFAF
jgi:hypothetical protein